ncbi:MAG: OB-fold nucleic acid binding domain-containing protein, partial [Desulfobacterota bacterium]|nr:OB-fold nucleic acid binding domain-containing protein [Thermodesulfobacteriota bacterium]
LWAVYEKAMEKGQQIQKQKVEKQKLLFMGKEIDMSLSENHFLYPEIPEWGETELLNYEKEALGFFISSHPLITFERELKNLTNTNTAEALNLSEGTEIKMGGVPVLVNEIKTKRGEIMAFVTLEDLAGSIEVVVFSELYKKISPIIKSEQPILIKGKVSMGTHKQRPKRKAEEIILLSEAGKNLPTKITFKLDISNLSNELLKKFKNILQSYPGTCPTYLQLVIPEKAAVTIFLPENYFLTPSKKLWAEIKSLLGEQAIDFDLN